MATQRNRQRRREVEPQTPFDQARDEMFQHIMRCGVIGSAPEHQAEWFDQTIQYLEDRYHELSETQVAELRTLGLRFCQPPKATQESVDAVQESGDTNQESVDIGPETADSSEEAAGSTAAA